MQAKILLIDDDTAFRESLATAFSEAGYRVVTAGDGIEGVSAYLDHHPDAVLADLIMPKMGGVAVCKEITRLADQDDPVVILLTTMPKELPHEHDAPDMGAKVHIPKSTNPLDIVILVEQLLLRRRNPHAG